MVEHQSKEVIDKLSRDLKIQPALSLPKNVVNSVQPIFNVNPDRELKAVLGSAIDAASNTIFTTDSKKETYIAGVGVTVSKDASATSNLTTVRAIPYGASSTSYIFAMRYEPLTAGQFTSYFTFPHPMRIKKGSTVTITNSTAIASIDASAVIYYYEIDPQ
jgi:hypothetical protein